MIRYEMISRTGCRKNNEDAVKVYYEKHCFLAALADGLGGHGLGELASALVTQSAVDVFREFNRVKPEHLRACFEKGQERLLAEQSVLHQEHGMKTTLTLLAIDRKHFLWGHIGDSRLYYFEDRILMNRTLDHSVPQALVVSGEITEDQIRRHPDRNRLLRVMGVGWDRQPYTLSEIYAVRPGLSFLLCSDGFWEWIEEYQMTECLQKARNPHEWINYMEDIVLKNGKDQQMDNYSAIAVWI